MHRLGKGEPSTFPLLLEGPEAARNICMAVPVGKENKGKKRRMINLLVCQTHGMT